MKRSLLKFVIGLSISALVVFLSLTYSYGTTNVISADYRQFNLRQEFLSTKRNEDVNAKPMKEEVRILCWILTSPLFLRRKAIHVRNTWARRCNVHVYMSLKIDEKFPAVDLNISDGNVDVTTKTVKGFRYVYDHYFEDADWFIKVDDDAYVIMENLRHFLSNENMDSSVYFGYNLRRKQGCLSGSAVHILSKEALRLFAKDGYDPSLCQQNLAFGTCIGNLGVKVGNSTDSLGRSRFHCFETETNLYDNKKDNNNYAISFHNVPPEKMYELEIQFIANSRKI